jgi:hypothetical protein
MGREESSLDERALAAAAEVRAKEQAEQDRQERERQKAERRQAEKVWRLKTEAAKRLEETLGYPSSPYQWEYRIHTWPSVTYEDSPTRQPFVETTALGVDPGIHKLSGDRQRFGRRPGLEPHSGQLRSNA